MARQRNDGGRWRKEKEREKELNPAGIIPRSSPLVICLPSLSVYQGLPKNGKEMISPAGRTRSLERKKEEGKRKKKKRRREEVKGNRAEANGIGQISRSVTIFPFPVRICRARSNEKFWSYFVSNVFSLIPPGVSSSIRIWRPFTRSKGLNNVAKHKGQVSSAGRHSWHFYEKRRVVARFSSDRKWGLSLPVSSTPSSSSLLLTTTAGEDHAPRKNLPRRRFNFVYSGMPPVPWRRKGIARDHSASSFQRG